MSDVATSVFPAVVRRSAHVALVRSGHVIWWRFYATNVYRSRALGSAKHGTRSFELSIIVRAWLFPPLQRLGRVSGFVVAPPVCYVRAARALLVAVLVLKRDVMGSSTYGVTIFLHDFIKR